MSLEEIRALVNDAKGNWIKEPTPVTIVGTTFGNEIQTKILTNIRITNLLTLYLCVFVTFRYIMGGN